MMPPRWIDPWLDKDGLAQIQAAVRRAEQRCPGQLVPAVAKQSAPWGHTPWVTGLLLLASAQSLGLSWNACLPWGYGSGWLLDLLSAGILGWALGRLPWLKRALTPEADLAAAVHAKARAAFFELGVHETKERSGILLFVSLTERRAVVLADQGISAKVDQADWDQVCEALIKGAASGDLARGWTEALGLSGALVQKRFPRRPKAGRSRLADGLRLLA